MSTATIDVVEFLLTARIYTEERSLEPDDLPPRYRRVFWAESDDGDDDDDDDDDDDGSARRRRGSDAAVDGGIKRPLVATEGTARAATGVDHPWEAVADLMFTEREEFSGAIELADPDMAEEWVRERADDERVLENPTLAYHFEGTDAFDVDYESARKANRPVRADRMWIDAMLDEYFDDEEEEEMLDLVDVRAPEEIDMTLDELVLTDDQEAEINKIVTAIEHREYLAEIGMREIGKLLFVGPPGTGKTSTARALAHELDLPFVEVKLSMITSQYLGETAKNVEKVFEVAKRLSPCIFFMDEFDFVAKTRKSDEHAAIKRAVNTLLKSIDDISLIQDDVLLIGATNHPDDLDAAAWRRFDEIVNFPKPDGDMRADILRVITREMDLENFDADELADHTEGLTGSDLRLVLREAVLDALTEGRQTLTQEDLLNAIEDFEERDNLKNMDMIEGDHDALVAGGNFGDGEAASDGGHAHDHDD